MQVILTEDEYLKLKHQSDDDKKNYIKRIDIVLALKELEEDLRKLIGIEHINSMMSYSLRNDGEWNKIFQTFIDKL